MEQIEYKSIKARLVNIGREVQGIHRLLAESERSEAVPRCPPSATGSAGARASDEAGADSSGRSADGAVRALVERIKGARELSHRGWRTYVDYGFVNQRHYASGQLDAFDAVLSWIKESPTLATECQRASQPNE